MTGPRLHVELSGGTGPYLLLVHGFLASRSQWLANLEGLRAFCRPVVAELWGHGRSPVPDDAGDYAVEAYGRQFEAIRRDLGAEDWFVCGQSFGAGLTIRYALDHPQVIRGLIITNSVSALGPPSEGGEAERRAAAEAVLAGGAAGLREMPYHPRFGRRLPPPVAARLLADAERLSPRGVAAAMQWTGPGLAVGEALSGLAPPTLLVNGTWERAFQPLRQDLERRLPGVQIVDLEGGHSINAEAADGFNAAVERFVRAFA